MYFSGARAECGFCAVVMRLLYYNSGICQVLVKEKMTHSNSFTHKKFFCFFIFFLLGGRKESRVSRIIYVLA
mgnify:CR=1 FL=1